GSGRLSCTRVDHDVLLAVHGVGDRAVDDHAADHRLPYDLAAVRVEGSQTPVEIAETHKVSRGYQRRSVGGLWLGVDHAHLARCDVDLGQAHVCVRIGARTQDAGSPAVTGLIGIDRLH